MGTVVSAGGCDTLALRITEFEAGVGAPWGGLCGPWGSTMVWVVRVSLCASSLLSYLGTLGLPARSPDPTYASRWGSCSLLLGLHSSASSLTLRPSSLALTITADSGGVTSVIDMMTLAVMGAAETGLNGVGFMVGEGALWDNVGTRIGLVGGVGGLLDGSIALELEDKVVGRNLVALGVVSLTNMAVVGLGGIGWSLGMVGALLDG